MKYGSTSGQVFALAAAAAISANPSPVLAGNASQHGGTGQHLADVGTSQGTRFLIVDSVQVDKSSNTAKYDLLKAEFEQFLKEYLRDSNVMSSIHGMMLTPSFLKLVGFGPQAVPWLIDRIDGHPIPIISVLSAVTRDKPVDASDRGNVQKMVAAWKKWGMEQYA